MKHCRSSTMVAGARAATQPVDEGGQRTGGIQDVAHLLDANEAVYITRAGDGAKGQRSALPFLERLGHADVPVPATNCCPGASVQSPRHQCTIIMRSLHNGGFQPRASHCRLSLRSRVDVARQ